MPLPIYAGVFRHILCMVKLHKVVSAEAAHLAARQVSYKIGFGLLRKEMELTGRDSIMSP